MRFALSASRRSAKVAFIARLMLSLMKRWQDASPRPGAGDLQSLVFELRCLHDPIQQSQPESLRHVDAIPQQVEFRRHGRADQLRQQIGVPVIARQADFTKAVLMIRCRMRNAHCGRLA